MYRVELQYDDISTTQLDPRKIPHYPVNDALQSVGGRNLVGLPWNALAEKQAQGSQAMLRDRALRSISISHGIPEVHLGHASPDLVAMHTPALSALHLATSIPVPPSDVPSEYPSSLPPLTEVEDPPEISEAEALLRATESIHSAESVHPEDLRSARSSNSGQRSLVGMVAARIRQENEAAREIHEGSAFQRRMREARQALQEERVHHLLGRSTPGITAKRWATKRAQNVGTSYDHIAHAPPAVEAGEPPVMHSAEIPTEPAYMEREGGTGALDPSTALAVPSVSSGSLQPYRAKVQDFNRFSKSTFLPASGAVGGSVVGFSVAGPPGALIGGTLGAMGGGALTAQSPAERGETMGYVFEGVSLAGQFSLAMAKLQYEFIGALSHMALREGNEQARAWLDWYGEPGMRRLSEPVQETITNPGVISQFTRTGRLPDVSPDARENSIAMRMLENLRKIRQDDPSSFDAMLGGITQDPNMVHAYIDHANGKRYYRGMKHINDLSPLERYSMPETQERRPLTAADTRTLQRQRRPMG